jgi:GH25 family lysozyme M1 (1,4-beta-N-acetylmuramidase)
VAGGVAVAVVLTVAPTVGAATSVTGARSGRPLVRGIDISAYQHLGSPINWRRLRRDGLRFVAIKVTEGTYYVNPYYRSDARDAARAGLAVMPYVFANPQAAGGAATARFAVLVAGYRRGPSTLPLVVDVENNPYRAGHCYGLGARRMVAWIAGFVARARALTGKRPVIYTTDDWWRQCTRSSSRFRRDPLWLAEYGSGRPSVPSPWHKWAFWQYDGDGFLHGIGLTDLDYFRPVGEFSSLHPAPHHKKHRKPRKHHKKKKHRKKRKHPRKRKSHKKHRKSRKHKSRKR